MSCQFGREGVLVAQGLRRVERLREVRQAVVVHCKSGVAVRIYAMIHLSGGMGGLSSAVLTVYSLFAEE